MYVHVDDISNLIVGRSQREVSSQAIKWARHFNSWTKVLKLDISDKSVVVPDNWAAANFAKLAERDGIPLKVAKEGVDIGVDAASAAKRVVTKQQERIGACKKKAKRACYLSRRNKRARKLAITAIKPAQLYGHTAVGMSPSSVNKCKANAAEATGLAGSNACSTSLLAWAFRRSNAKAAHVDPRVAIPTDEIKAWMGMWSRAALQTRKGTTKVWAKAYRTIGRAKNR